MNLQELLTPPGGYLVLGGILSFFVTLLHIFFAIRPRAWAFFGAGELSEIAKEGSSFILPVTLGLIVMFAAWSAYAFSGADLIGRLPLLQIVLYAIAIIYLLRALYIPSELVGAIKGTKPIHLLFVSLGSLAAGLLYLFGVLGLR